MGLGASTPPSNKEMRVKLVCHIGTPKTASTLIQNTCDANPEWLAEHGLAYGKVLAPDANHITLMFICANELHDFARDYGIHSLEALDTFHGKVCERIEWHLGQLGPDIHTVIMSSENLTGNMGHIDEINRLKALLTPYFDEIEIVTYVRRQDEGILSMYGEFMRRGFSDDTFAEFVDFCLGEDTPTQYLYYRRELMKWIEVFGRENVHVRRFVPGAFKGGDILSDFMSFVLGMDGEDQTVDLTGFEPSRDDNRGLSAPVLEALRRMHPRIPFIKDGQPNIVRTTLTPFISLLPQHPRPVMSPERGQRIMSHFAGANGWLKETFFPELPGPVFPQRVDQPQQGNIGQLTLDEFADISGQLLDSLYLQD